MSELFKAIRGTLVNNELSNTTLVTVEGLDTKQFLMLSDVRASRNEVVQYLKTLDNSNYGYAWGEGPGSITVSGLIFFVNECSISGAGFQKINDYFDQNNVYNKNETIKIAIGDAAFNGYLVSFSVAAEQNEFNYGSFTLQFTILPLGV